jgi:hypothetical protein
MVIAVVQAGHRHCVGGRQSNAVGRNTVVRTVMVIGINSDLVEENRPTTDTMQHHRVGVGVAARGRRPPATAGGVQLLTAATLPTCVRRMKTLMRTADVQEISGVRRPTVATLVRLAVFRLGEVVAYFEDHANHLAAHGQADPACDEKKEIHTWFLPLSVKLCCWSFASPGTPRVGMHRRVVSAGCRRRFVGKSPWQLPREKSQSPRRFHR